MPSTQGGQTSESAEADAHVTGAELQYAEIRSVPGEMPPPKKRKKTLPPEAWQIRESSL